MTVRLGYDGSRYDDVIPLLINYHEGGRTLRLFNRVTGRWHLPDEWQRFLADTGYVPHANEVGDVAFMGPDGVWIPTAAQIQAMGGPVAAGGRAVGGGMTVGQIVAAITGDPAAMAQLQAAVGGGVTAAEIVAAIQGDPTALAAIRGNAAPALPAGVFMADGSVAATGRWNLAGQALGNVGRLEGQGATQRAVMEHVEADGGSG